MLSRETDFRIFFGWLRLQLHYTQQDLANELGASLRMVRRWEQRKSKPHWEYILRAWRLCTDLVNRGIIEIPENPFWDE